MAVDAVGLKLPAVWTDDIETWFQQAESQFAIRGITTEETKYHHVVAVLTSEVAARARNIIRNPPAFQPYSVLKAALVENFELTEHERAAAIFNITALGDAKPLQVMERMENLLGASDARILLRYHFISILPDYVRNTLSFSDTVNLRELAKEADRIFLTGRDASSPHVHAASTEPDAEINRVKAKSNRRVQPQNIHSQTLCFYHSRFGTKARKCEHPCTFDSGNASAGQRQ
jgi:hypothetical protein